MKDRMKMMDLLGSIVDVAAGGERLAYTLGKRPPSFLSYSFENKPCGTGRHSQTASGCGVDFVLFLNKKGPLVLHVWPYAKSQARRIGGEGIVLEQKGGK